MALLGAIRPGTIPSLIRLLADQGATATLACEQGSRRVDFYFSAGKIEQIEINGRPDESGIDVVSGWGNGVYRLFKGLIEKGAGGEIAGEGGKRTILVASADSSVTDTAEVWLEQVGYQVNVALHPEQILEIVQQSLPDLLVLDTTGDEEDLGQTRLIREHFPIDALPILVLTGAQSARLAQVVHHLGVSTLTKPVTGNSLVGTVTQELQLHALRSSRDFSTLAVPSDSPDLAADILGLLLFDENLPPLDAVFDKTPKLGIKIALGEATPESVALLDLFDGRNSLREIIAANPKQRKKILFLASYMTRTGLLDTLAQSPRTEWVVEEEEDSAEYSEVPLPRLSPPTSRSRPDAAFFTAADTIVLGETLRTVSPAEPRWAKLVTLGLPTPYRFALSDTLRFISEVQAGFVKRGASLGIPALPQYEIARVLLRSDLLLTVHDVEAENQLTEVVEKLGDEIWGFVFFVSMHQRSAMSYLRSLVQSVTKNYPRPFMVNLLNVGQSVETDAIQLVQDTLELDRDGRVGIWNIQSPEAIVKMIGQLILVS